MSNVTARRMKRKKAERIEAPALVEGHYTRQGLIVRRWNSLEPRTVALQLPTGDHLIAPESVADEIIFARNPFGGLFR